MPSQHREAVTHVCGELGVSERRACRVLGQPRSTQRYEPLRDEKDKLLIKRLHETCGALSSVWLPAHHRQAW